ncbi:AAA family ATPase [Thermosynechococcus sp. B0]|uniref:ParA family protein n=1 Tax=unclassified Thermosynechococcus TaxID=2622553 RepID=UPI002578495C|nr:MULTISPECIES: AAA family ATPase [unclassified Thermosynechococcus]WJI25317.1 AAA family ATPase [Thermosynechococcus sp. B0]WJI27847.1 AAA family ATPase [Thermosynechococcus sp. B1]WJI30381.1 AAA family ATPase [Thermosynechococcus sp. B3]
MKVITIYHNKGGVGKTTVAVNLAAAFRCREKRVLVIDMDSQANTTFATGLMSFLFEEEDTLRDAHIFHVLRYADEYPIEKVVRKSQSFNHPEIDVVPAHIDLVSIETRDLLKEIDAIHLQLLMKLEALKDAYDIVIIDAPPAWDLYAEIALIASDYLIIPSDFKPFANQGLKYVISFVKDINRRFADLRVKLGKKPLDIVGILPSKIHGRTRNSSKFIAVQEAITNKYPLKILETIITECVDLSSSLNRVITVGDSEIPAPQSIFRFKPNSNSAREFNDLVDELNWITQS